MEEARALPVQVEQVIFLCSHLPTPLQRADPQPASYKRPGKQNATKPDDMNPVFLAICCATSSKQHYLSASVQLSERDSVALPGRSNERTQDISQHVFSEL